MATTEERLAALEAKLAQLTATTPTTYYTHQYSGEEIDAAVGRAVSGGALDTSVTNVSNQLGTFVRPNLLDNWYFGNPVNQREGKIIPAGKSYYTTPDITLPEVGKTDKAYTVIEIKNYSGYGQRATISISGTVYYVWDQDAVRGYTGNRYMVDRWKITYDNGQISITDGYVSFLGSGVNFSQFLDENVYKPLRGKTVTLSIIGRGDCQIVSEDAPYSYNAAFLNSDVFTLASFSFITKSDSDRFIFHIKPNTSNPVDILAAKLELGSTQTLAHQENGVWVMNEVPEYGEQLRRCQRYHYRLRSHNNNNYAIFAYGMKQSTTEARFIISFPAPLRTRPVITYSGAFLISDGKTDYTVSEVTAQSFNGESICLTCKSTEMSSLANGTCMRFSAKSDANAYVDFSADL